MDCITGTEVEKAAEWLKKGYAIGIPTETVYGLAANATDESAVLKVFQIKNRPSFDPLIVHVGAIATVLQIAEVPDTARKLMEQFWPGPLTLLLTKKPVVPDLVTSGLPTVGVRMPDHPLTLELLRKLPFPLAAPSANPFGYISPTTAEHVRNQLGDKIPYILDGGPCKVGVESTIVSVEKDTLLLHRQGGISMETLQAAGYHVVQISGEQSAPSAPGMLDSHYAPLKPLFFGKASTLFSRNYNETVAVLCLNKALAPEIPDGYRVYELSKAGDNTEAASQLFAVMRMLDESDCQTILAVEFPDEGLGRAINDRLKRASVKRAG
jgi:L-threonylcarbamoyladenylate synthase